MSGCADGLRTRAARAWAVVWATTLAAALAACGERASAPATSAASASASYPAQAAAAGSAVVVDNALVTYLRGAEVQAETDSQRRELRRALADLLERPAADWQSRRYAGARGEPGQRDLVQVLRAHLLPTTPIGLDAGDLAASAGHASARAVLRELVERLDRDLGVAPPPSAAPATSSPKRGAP